MKQHLTINSQEYTKLSKRNFHLLVALVGSTSIRFRQDLGFTYDEAKELSDFFQNLPYKHTKLSKEVSARQTHHDINEFQLVDKIENLSGE